MLEVFKFEKFLLERGYHGIFVLRVSLLKQSGCSKIPIHILIEFYLEINYLQIYDCFKG